MRSPSDDTAMLHEMGMKCLSLEAIGYEVNAAGFTTGSLAIIFFTGCKEKRILRFCGDTRLF
jgi:hypothetical protein